MSFAPLESLIYALAVSCLFYAALRFGERRVTGRTITLLALGLTITAMFAFVEYRMLPSMLELTKVIEQKLPVMELPPKWGEDRSPDQRALSILFAQNAYFDHGKLIEYVDRDGKRVRFSPTENDIEDRAKRLARDIMLDTRNDMISGAWRRWLTTTIAILLFGFVVARAHRTDANGGT